MPDCIRGVRDECSCWHHIEGCTSCEKIYDSNEDVVDVIYKCTFEGEESN